MRRIVLVGLSLAWMGLQSCTPVFAQSDPSPEAVQAEEKARTPAQKKSDEKKAVFEKNPNEPGTWDKVKETTNDAVEYGTEKSQDIGRKLGATRSRRQESKYTLAGNYSLFEMWTLTKYGLTFGYNKNESTTYEFEYMRGSLGFGYFGIDLGAIEEERFGLNWRSYGKRNSFTFVTGLYYNILEMHLGSKALESVSNGMRTSVDLLEIHTVGLNWGIGNRWQTKRGFVWGADWLSINIPVLIVKQEHPFIDATNNEGFREDAKDALKFFRRIPEIAALKVQLGFSF